MPTKKTGKTAIKPPNHVRDSLKKKASEVNDTSQLPDENKQAFDKFKLSKTATEVKNKKTEETIGTGNATIETKKSNVDASWSDFPEAHKLLKVANQKRSSNDLRGAIDTYIQVYNNLEKVGKIPSKRLTLKIISKIACAHMDLGEYEEASRALENAACVQISLADLLYNEAKVAVERNENGSAETLISEAMDLWKHTNNSEDSSNKYVQILEMGSNVLFSAKKFKKSVEAYNKIIEYSSQQNTQLNTSYLTKRREHYRNFTQLINDDVDLLKTVTEEYDLADIVVDCSMSKSFCFYKGKNCYKNLDLALKLSLNNASLQTSSFRIFIHSGVYEWPQKETLQAFLSNFEATSKQKCVLRMTGASDVVFLPNTNDQGDSLEIVEFPTGEIHFKNVSFGEIKSFRFSFGGYQKGFLVNKQLKNLTLYFERKTNVHFESCRFSNIKIESRTTLSKSDRSTLTFDFCHFENDDCTNFEFCSAPWWKVSLSNCAIKQNNGSTGVVAKINCHMTLSNSDIDLDSYKTGNKLIVMGDTAKFTATGCCFESKNCSKTELVGIKEEILPLSKNNTMKLWDRKVIMEPWNAIHHKPHDLIVLNGATCYIEKSYLFWNVRVNSSAVTIKQCLISSPLTPGKVSEAVALEENGKMVVVGNTFEEYALGVKVSMGAEALIDKNKFLKGSFCAILVQQHSAPTIRRNSFLEDETLGQMCAILYLPEFSCGRIEHNTFQDFSFQPIVIFQENKVKVIHNSYVDIDYMHNALPSNSLCPPKPWFMTSAQDYLLQTAFKNTYDDIFPNKMRDVFLYNVVSRIGCEMMERKWPNDDISEFWKSDYETKIKKKIPSCTKHKTAPAMHENCVYCDSEYETGSELDEESGEDTDGEDDFSSNSDDCFLDHFSKTVKQGQVASAQMIQRKEDIEKKRASREKERRKREEKRAKVKADKRLCKDTYIAVLGGAQLKECFSCGKVKIEVQHCSRCKLVYSCDTVCQKAGWSSHKVLCKIASL